MPGFRQVATVVTTTLQWQKDSQLKNPADLKLPVLVLPHSTTTEIGRSQHDWVNARKMGTTEIFSY